MVEERIRFWAGCVLWSLSGVVAVGLYVALAGTNFLSIAVSLGLALGLEVGKVLCFRRGGWHRIIALGLSLLTVLSIVGGALITIENRKEQTLTFRIQSLHDSKAYKDLLERQESLQNELESLLGRIKDTPPTWITLTLKLVDSANVLRDQEIELASKLASLEVTAIHGAHGEEQTLFSSVGSLLGQEAGRIELILVLVVAVMVEVTAFALLGTKGKLRTSRSSLERTEIQAQGNQVLTQSSSPNFTGTTKSNPVPTVPTRRSPTITPDVYLKVAVDHSKSPYLLGRQKVCERLGITETEARDFIEVLVRDGKVTRAGKFFVAV